MRRWPILILLSALGCGEPEPAASISDGAAPPDAAPVDAAALDAAEPEPLPDAAPVVDADADPPAMDAAPAPDGALWPAPDPIAPPPVTLVIDGAIVANGQRLPIAAPPAGLDARWTASAVLTNRSAAPVDLLADGWIDGAGWALDGAPGRLAPDESARFTLSFSAQAMDRATTGVGTLRVPTTPPLVVHLTADVPRPLRTVVVGDGGLILRSDDYGASFQIVAEPNDATRRATVAWGAGRFLRSYAIGGEWRDPAEFQISEDGVDWRPVEASPEFWPGGCAYGLDRFACVYNGLLAWSTDGAAMIHEAGWGQLLHGMAFGADRFVGVGRNARRAVSLDGRTWIHDHEVEGGDFLNAVAFDGVRWIAVGGREQFVWATSVDGGETWDMGTDPRRGRAESIACTAERCLIGTAFEVDPLMEHVPGVGFRPVPSESWVNYRQLGVVDGWFIAAVQPWQAEARLVRSRDGRAWEEVWRAAAPGGELRGLASEAWP